MALLLLAATTDEAYSDSFTVTGERLDMPAVFTCPGLTSTDTGTVQRKNVDGSFSDCYDNGALVQVTATNTEVTVSAPGVYRVHKSASTSASVEVHTPGNP